MNDAGRSEVEWQRILPPASEERIERFEKRRGLTLPPLYRAFLQTTNGGHAKESVVFSVPEVGQRVMLGLMYGLADDEEDHRGIDFWISENEDDLPPELLPIGENPGGAFLLLTVAGPHMEEVRFWDSHGFFPTIEGRNVYPVAPDIDAFLASLAASARE